MTTTETVYKVVCKRKINYYSINARGSAWWQNSLKEIRKRLGGCLFQYELGKETKKKQGLGPLLAFKTLYFAEYFAESVALKNHIVIFECERILSERQDYYLTSIFELDKARDYWSNKEMMDLGCSSPKGTVFCDSITPIKVVKVYDKISSS